jgi:hypothetical protein
MWYCKIFHASNIFLKPLDNVRLILAKDGDHALLAG